MNRKKEELLEELKENFGFKVFDTGIQFTLDEQLDIW